MFGKLSEDEIEALLSAQQIGRIGCSTNGKTYIIPVGYAYEDDCVYVHTQKGLKMDIMRENPDVCFQVDHTADLANWKSVISWGKFEELTDKLSRQAALKILMNRKIPFQSSRTMDIVPEWPFYDETDVAKGIFFRIRLSEKTGRFEMRNLLPDGSLD
ncbi:MAG: pyridoxamine 5'-phosphate oxidase family protein [Sphingobacteriales bacterium]|nr:MAG: pyridoxamine 5'-phosphate oxidase family protein [Sphingobacteriales bacterium]